MKVHLVDGTYELFRHFFAVPAAMDANGQDVGGVRGVLGTVLSMIERGATHIGVATDHVAESFRNDLYAGYKTSEGVPPALLAQFPIPDTARFFPWAWWPRRSRCRGMRTWRPSRRTGKRGIRQSGNRA